jgi:ribonuclease HI
MHELTKETRFKKIGIFLDIEKAFELVNKDVILTALISKGITGKTIALIDDFLTDRKARVVFQGCKSSYHNLENGTPQGSVLSATLFNLVMESFISNVNIPGVKILCYADDVLILADGPNQRQKIQETLKILEENAKTFSLKISEKKTKAMAFNSPDPQYNFSLYNKEIEWVKHHKYLGIFFDKHLKFNCHINYLHTKCLKRINLMKSLTTINKGASAKVLKTYYLTAIRSLIDYSAPVLSNITINNSTILQKIQNSAMRIILGAPLWTSVFNMQTELHILPIKDRIMEINGNIIIKNMFNSERLLSEDIRNNINSLHISNITDLLNKADIHYKEIISNETYNNIHEYKPWEEVPAEFIMKKFVNNKKKANAQQLCRKYIKHISNVNKDKDLITYTDGSVDIKNNRAGSAAIIKNNNSKTIATLKKRLNGNVSSLQTELYAIALDLTYSRNMKNTRKIIHTDSLNAIINIKKTIPTEEIQLTKTIHKLISIHKENDNNITFNYIPSHIGLVGNEQADIAAKQSLCNPNIDFILSPGSSALKSKFKRYLHQKNTIGNNPDSITDSVIHYSIAAENIQSMNFKCRKQEVMAYRLLLGYKTYNQLIHIRTLCDNCINITDNPLVHYVCECNITSPYFNSSRIPTLENAAASINNIFSNKNHLLKVISKFPPPR